MRLEEVDPWLGDRVRCKDGREGVVRGGGGRGDRDWLHIQFDDGTWADEVPESEVVVVVLNEAVPLKYRRGRKC
jgi:hypothetical protein